MQNKRPIGHIVHMRKIISNMKSGANVIIILGWIEIVNLTMIYINIYTFSYYIPLKMA